MRTKLKALRKTAGFTQQGFGDVVGISQNHYSQIECGVKNPSFKVARKMKEVLGYSQDDLFDNS